MAINNNIFFIEVHVKPMRYTHCVQDESEFLDGAVLTVQGASSTINQC